MSDEEKVKRLFLESIRVKNKCIEESSVVLVEMAKSIVQSIKNGGKLMICGNGGSAADAQHLAAEMLVRLRSNKNRDGIPAIALAMDTSSITACGNDFGFDSLYERMLESLGTREDILLVISTSGNSKNILKVIKKAIKLKIKVFGFLGSNGGAAVSYCERSFIVPSNTTGRIQEAHITAGHAVMELVENHLISNGHIQLWRS